MDKDWTSETEKAATVAVESTGLLAKEFPPKSKLKIGHKTVTVYKVVEHTPPGCIVSDISDRVSFTPSRPAEVHLHWWSGDELKTKILTGDEIDILR